VVAAPSWQSFGITVAAEDDDVTIVVRGEVDASTSPTLDDVLACAIEQARHVTANLGDVTFIDACGLRSLIDADRRLRASGRRLDLTDPGPAVRRLLSLLQDEAHFER
jgi:anti-anti-sigma factor